MMDIIWIKMLNAYLASNLVRRVKIIKLANLVKMIDNWLAQIASV